MTSGLPLLRRACTALAAVLVAAGCGHTESLRVASVPTLPPPTPVGMEQLPPQPPLPPDGPDQNCDLTASLRPFPTKAEADAAVADIRASRPADRRARHRQQPVQLPRPDHRRDHRLRRRHRRRDRPRHLRRALARRVPDPVVGRAGHRAAARRGRRRGQDHDHHLRPAQAGELLHRVPRCQPAHPGPARLADHQGLRPVRQTRLRGQGHHVAAPDPADRSPADRGVGGQLGRLPGRHAAARDRRRQHRRLDPGRAGRRGPVPAHRRAEHGHPALRHRDQPEQHRVGALRQRNAGADPPGRHLEHVVPQVVDRAGPAPAPPTPRYLD